MEKLKVQHLADRVNAAMAGRPALGGVVLVDFGGDGSVVIGNKPPLPLVSAHAPPAPFIAAACTISLSLATLEKFEGASNFTRAWMLADGEVRISGDRALAERLASALQSAS